jgi:hypothetical protein
MTQRYRLHGAGEKTPDILDEPDEAGAGVALQALGVEGLRRLRRVECRFLVLFNSEEMPCSGATGS